MYGWRRIIDNVNDNKTITAHAKMVICIKADGLNSSY